ncbi:hypothetical protein Ocin01_17300, partial [Orchesella cincta]
NKWSRSAKDKLVLHTLYRCKPLPSLSPFGLKLETYLRMAKIPYEASLYLYIAVSAIETKDLMGPHGKMPWVTYNGVNIADSQLIIEFLNKEFGVSINASNISKEQLAAARACRIVMEDHFLFGIMQYRVVDNINSLHKLMKIPTILKPLLPIQLRQTKQKMVGQGIGAHSPEDIYQMTEADLHTASAMLGSKRFFSGDEPCDDDCGIFGLVAQAVWGMPGSSFERLCDGELLNLKEYCERIKEGYWPDWEDCLDKME